MTRPATPSRAKKAYEEVAASLRDQIVGGQLANGDRLPNETVLAKNFGVSRATVREALRLLTAQDLIRTAKGAGGGSYVQVPSVYHIADFLHSSINLLTAAHYVTLEDLLEARELLEVPAARLAATRRRESDLDRLREAIPGTGLKLDVQQQFSFNRDFHSVVLDVCGNTLLSIAAQPVFTVLMTGFARSMLGSRFHRAVHAQHREIANAIEHGDADAAGGLMHEHLEFLRPTYEKIWRQTDRGRHP